MKIHYYGRLDSLESCYTFQEFDINGMTLLLQNSSRFGYKPATMTIKDPAMFIIKENGFFRFVVEEFEVNVKNGVINIGVSQLEQLLKEALSHLK